ncbi:hypothetical protein [Nonomuraea salmonea]|uniref:hypothetical protein n=1 Tax=Nonomuraea salmonea TaxID=46181 RepID=UPI002FE714ED
MNDGHFCTPRQVTAGVPGYLDTVTVRACLPESRRGQGALSSPSEVAEALADVARPMPIPISYPSTPAVASASHTEGLDIAHRQQSAPPPLPPVMQPRRPSGGGGSTLNRVLMTLVVLLVIAAVGVGAWTIGRSLGSPTTSQTTSASPTASASAPAETQAVKPVKAQGFDPLGDGDEKPDLAKLAIDGKPSTLWKTETYTSADLGRLKDGVGLLLDMGKSVQISDVVATLSDASGATVELKVGDSPELGSLKTVATKKNAAGKTTLAPEQAVTGQYVFDLVYARSDRCGHFFMAPSMR